MATINGVNSTLVNMNEGEIDPQAEMVIFNNYDALGADDYIIALIIAFHRKRQQFISKMKGMGASDDMIKVALEDPNVVFGESGLSNK